MTGQHDIMYCHICSLRIVPWRCVHVMVQAVKGLLLGQTGRRQHQWRSHLFRVLDDANRPQKLHFFLRLFTPA